jgi:hypothetical protein
VVSVSVRRGRDHEQHGRSRAPGMQMLKGLGWWAFWAQLGAGLYYSFGPGPDNSFRFIQMFPKYFQMAPNLKIQNLAS